MCNCARSLRARGAHGVAVQQCLRLGQELLNRPVGLLCWQLRVRFEFLLWSMGRVCTSSGIDKTIQRRIYVDGRCNSIGHRRRDGSCVYESIQRHTPVDALCEIIGNRLRSASGVDEAIQRRFPVCDLCKIIVCRRRIESCIDGTMQRRSPVDFLCESIGRQWQGDVLRRRQHRICDCARASVCCRIRIAVHVGVCTSVCVLVRVNVCLRRGDSGCTHVGV
mmetsp:Transcript_32250/g.89057  ORF Transcript_32250/g.89057 Transcript_32250/m.89057 type:complete len:221 (+) Transcript_32250:406-1068(+)